ncbi:NAD(P)-dependent oxidoreductase [Nocardioides immobilis]|uniref:NAD(P)-dependent oxidoreductase n=1 Tax=Nocardioides immobilis TaxID=2049295 RepID=A0A417Y109_9ACTN|nr:mycofactocin-coupled SDR family oxidoreductase [Nocardioides immobilis]RHW26271.1 NAD(P)-dependent oxidoreductase [Nocardioides immobilis]
MSGLESKVAFVTGAAHGQGRSHAVGLAKQGVDIIAVDVCGQIPLVPYALGTKEELDETVALVQEAGRQAIGIVADVRDGAAISAAAVAGEEHFGRIDIVVANAGVNLDGAPAQDIPDEAWQLMLDINLTGVWHTARSTVPALLRAGGGSIIMTSSVAALRPYSGIAHYNAAKAGVVALMQTMALELAPHGVRVNTLNPSAVETPMIMNEALMRNFVPESPQPTHEEFASRAQLINAMPIPWVQPIDITNAVIWLASDEARYVTGVALPIDAGARIK